MRGFVVNWFPAVVLLLALVCGKIYAVHKEKKRKRLLERCISTTGKVRLVERWDAPLQTGTLNHKWELEAEFEYGGRTYFTFADRQMKKPDYAVGDEITVYFDPAHPEDNTIIL